MVNFVKREYGRMQNNSKVTVLYDWTHHGVIDKNRNIETET
jgi:hypothetical protein